MANGKPKNHEIKKQRKEARDMDHMQTNRETWELLVDRVMTYPTSKKTWK